MYKSNLPNLDLKNKRVFLRADLNVPLKDGKVVNNFRLKQIKETLDFLLQNKAKIILATHIGRPNGFNPNLSTKLLINWFESNGYKVEFAQNFQEALTKSKEDSDKILILENLRFYPGEKSQDIEFARQLRELADVYVDDAFGSIHRNDTSVTLLPKQFAKDKRTFGFCVERELNALEKVLNPEQPFLLILGGGKIKDKINLLNDLIKKVSVVQLCPAIVFTFLKLQDKEIGKSLIDEAALTICKTILESANKNNVKILFPEDYLVAQDDFNNTATVVDSNNFGKNDIGISIGPKTTQKLIDEIKKAKTILFNGFPGDLRKENLEIINKIFDAMSQSQAYTIVAGGDSVAAACLLGYENKIDYFSTGGGATMSYLSGKELPGLKALD